MYERNAVVIDRYFSEMFGYGEKNNLKSNYNSYCDLVTKVKKYLDVSDAEDNIMIEFEKVANEIKETQKMQETFYRKNIKLQETRKSLFDDLDEDSEKLKRKFERVEEEINKNNSDIKSNVEKFISEISEFNEKSVTRTQYGKERRIVESDYQKILSNITDNFNTINVDKVNDAKNFLRKEDNEEEKNEIKLQVLKNGANEKVPFNEDVIINAIKVSTNIESKKLEIYVSAYERTNKILGEIRNDTLKIERHEKFIKDSENKLKFLNTISEYIILFLDNERMNVVGGQKEHKKLMEEACQNFDKDLVQIKNMYDLILKEASGKVAKKSYGDLYNPQYLKNLLNEENLFEKSISKLNVMGAVIYPSYWRVEGMQKIFDAFKNIVSEEYGRDLSEYEPEEIKEEVRKKKEEKDDELDFNWDDEEKDIEIEKDKDKDEDNKKVEQEEENEWIKDDYYEEFDEDLEDEEDDDQDDEDEEDDEEDDEEQDYDEKDDETEENNDYDSEEDEDEKTIDQILGFYNESRKSEEEEDDDDEIDIDFDWDEEEKNEKESEIIKDEPEKDIKETKKKRGFFNKKKK